MKYHTQSFRWLASVLVMAPVLAAQSMSPSGSFGFLINASYFNRPNNNGQALVGVMNFDGAGNVTGPFTAEFGALGNQAAQSIAGTFTGKYSSKTDGTGSVTIALVLLCYKQTFSCRIVLWDHASLRQAHNRFALRHILRAWPKPQGTPTAASL